jgi:HlyD family secretion protein
MKSAIRWILVLLVLVGLGAAVFKPAADYWRWRTRPHWRQAEVTRGRIVEVVNSTGTIKPVLSVSIGSFVSGPILELFAEFNQEVKKGDLLATIDPRIYESNVARDRATLATRAADVNRAKAVMQLAINDEKRAFALRAEDPTFISQADLDKYRFNRASLEAQVKVAETSVDQAQAQLDYSTAQLNYTKIISPVDGTIINRKIDPGQTLAAQFQTPELFIIAPDMRLKMHVHASVDEADIGLIQEAQKKNLPVHFTVDAHPRELFEGTVEEIRLSSTTTQNVVTYPVIVATKNPDLKLLPGMTASISFQVAERKDVLKIPNAALRFYPAVDQVREADKKILEGDSSLLPSRDVDAQGENTLSADDRTELRRQRSLRHVWIAEGDKLRAVQVTVGLSDSKFTEMESGELKESDQLVTGIEPPK